jgi:tetratricopeptide (TPR) repeat protein
MNFRKILALIVSALMFLTACGGRGGESAIGGKTISAAELISQADNLYKEREDLAKVRTSLELLRQARIADGMNFEATWKTAQFNYFLGNNTKDEKERDTAFKEGIAAGRSAVRLQPERADGYFWTGANLGGQAQADFISGAGNVSEIRQNMEKAIQLQPNYEGGTAYVALAQIELRTRGIMGGDAGKAAAYLEQALQTDKNNSFAYYYLAEAYFALNRKPEARKMLDALRKLPVNPDYVPERREIAEKAQKLEARL